MDVVLSQPATTDLPAARAPCTCQLGFPSIDGPERGAKVAFFRRGQACTPDTIDRKVTSAEVDDMRTHAGRLLPTLPVRFLKAATCMYSNTPDQHFVIAKHPEHVNVTVACGFSGHGFKFVPVVGEVLADLATTGSTTHPIDLFDPRRPALRREALEVTARPPPPPAPAGSGPDCGAVPADPTTGGQRLVPGGSACLTPSRRRGLNPGTQRCSSAVSGSAAPGAGSQPVASRIGCRGRGGPALEEAGVKPVGVDPDGVARPQRIPRVRAPQIDR